MSLPLLHAGRTNPGLSAALDLRFALDKSLTAYRGPTPSFSRASTGSYFDGSGVLRYASINVQSYSEDFSNAYWTKANSSVLTDQTASPDGKNTADKLVENSSTAFHQIYNTGFSTTSGSPATISVYVKTAGRQFVQFYISSNMGNGYANFDIVNGTLGTVSGTGITATITSVGNGWFRISASQSSCTTGTAYFQLGTILTSTSTQAQAHLGDGVSGVFIWGAQGELSSTVGTYCPTTSSANSAPRFDHTYNGTSWVSRGLLVEEQRTNYVKHSGSLSTNWTLEGSATRTLNSITSPDGSTNATRIDVQASAYSGIYQTVTNGGAGVYTFSVFIKKGTKDWFYILNATGQTNSGTFFNVSNGTVGTVFSGYSASITDVGNGWYRCRMTTSSTTPTYFQTGFSDSDNSITPSSTGYGYMYGAQMELGAFATSYIGTTNSSVVRSADVCQITGADFSGFWNGTEGSVAVEYDRLAAVDSNFSSGYPRIVTAVKTSDTSRAVTLFASQSPSGEAFFVQDGTVQAWFSAGSLASANVSTKLSTGYKANDFAASLNGAAVATDASGTIPSGIDRMDIGNEYGVTRFHNGHIARLRYFNKRLPNATLQLLSEPDPTLNLQFALNKSLTPVAGPAPSFSRASTGTYFNASGVLTSASINTPRFDHVYSGGQWVSKGLLVEEQRTNLALWSEDLSNGYWTKTNCSITADAIVSPDGNSNADLAEFSASGTAPRVFQTQSFSVTSGTSYTKSFFVKAGTQRWIQIVWSGGAHSARFANFDTLTMTFGTVSANVTTSVANVGNGWYRVSATSAATATALDLFWIYAVDSGTSGWASNSTSGGSVYVFGFQHEAGSFPTSYTGTTSSSVTRSADVCQITGTSFNWMWNQGEGSVAFEAGTFSDSSYLGRYLEFTRTSSVGSPSIGVGTINSAGSAGGDNVYNYVWDSSTQAALYASPARPLAKSSFAWKVNDFAASINGATALTDTSGTVPTGIDVLTIGSRYGSLNIINGHIAKLIYYPARLTNTKLQQLST